MNTNIIAAEVLSGGQSAKVTLSVASAQGPIVSRPTNHPKGVPVKCLILSDVVCWIRKGTNPTAVADGTDQYVPANTPMRIELMEDERLAAIAGGAGNLYFTPGA